MSGTLSVTRSATRPGGVARVLAPTLFLAPAIALLLLFLVWPLIDSFRLSTLQWNGLGAGRRYIGLANWIALVKDTLFWSSLGNNLILGLLSVLIFPLLALTLLRGEPKPAGPEPAVAAADPVPEARLM